MRVFVLQVAGPDDPVAAVLRDWPDEMSRREFDIRSTDVLHLIDKFWSIPPGRSTGGRA